MTRYALSLILLIALSVTATQANAEPNPREIIEKAAAAVEKVNAVSYTASYHAEGAVAKLAPTIEADLVARRGQAAGNHFIAIDGKIKKPGAKAFEPFKFASDGKQFFDLSPMRKTFTVADIATTPLMRYRASPIFPNRFLDKSAFKSELTSAELTYIRLQDVNGVACHVITAVYGGNRFGQSTLYLGKDDYLVRRIVRELTIATRAGQAEQKGRVELSIKNLNVQPEISDDAFKLTAPQGYRTTTPAEVAAAAAAGQGGRRGLLETGDEAPAFELPQADGTKIALKDLRGKYVVLDFWATWCGPCKKAMPELQKLHDHFKDEPVAVFGVNCRERGGDPMRYVKLKGYTYPQLLQGDRVATQYRVSGIPCIYVIDPEGKICFSFAGYHPQMESMLTSVIEDGIKKAAPQDQTAKGPNTITIDR